jgi:hypothetical protein
MCTFARKRFIRLAGVYAEVAGWGFGFEPGLLYADNVSLKKKLFEISRFSVFCHLHFFPCS